MPVTSFRHDRKQIILPVAIFPPALDDEPNRMVKLSALLDTGASASGIPASVALELRLSRRGKEIITTVGGTAAAGLSQFRIGVYHDEGGDLPYVLDRAFIDIECHPGAAFQALLGMDMVGRADFEIRADGSGSLRFG